MEHWNKKVARNRGEAWRKNLVSGRFKILNNPTTIRIKRMKKGLTQGAIASSLGLTYTTYGAIETGTRPVKQERAIAIAKQLKISLDKAFRQDGDKFVAI